MQLYATLIENIKKYRFNSIFVRILALILALCVACNLFLGIYFYKNAYSRIEAEIANTNGETLQRVLDRVDEAYSYIYTTLLMLSSNSDVKMLTLQSYADNYSLYTGMKNVLKQLEQVVDEGAYIDDAIMYLPTQNRMIGKSGVVIASREAYAWDRTLLDALMAQNEVGVRTLLVDRGGKPCIVFYMSLPLTGTAKRTCLCVYVGIDALSQYAAANTMGLLDAIDVQSADGKRVFSISGASAPQDLSSPGPDYARVRAQSAVSGLTVTGYMHKSSVTGYLSSFAGALFFAMALFTVLLFVLCYAIALRIYAPYARLSANFSADAQQDKNEFAFINSNLRSALNESQRLRLIVQDNLGVIRTNYLLGLVRGALETREVIARKAKLYQLRLDPLSPFFMLMFLLDNDAAINREAELELEVPVFIDLMRARFPDAEFLAYKNDAVLALAPGDDAQARTYGVSIFRHARAMLEKREGLTCRAIRSDSCPDVLSAKERFEAIRRVMGFGFALPPWRLQDAAEFGPAAQDGNDFVIEAKNRIAYYIGKADKDEARRVIDELYDCVSAYANPAKLLDFFIAQMIGTLEFDYIRGEELPPELRSALDALYNMFCTKRDYFEIKTCLTGIVESLCSHIAQSRALAHRQTMDAAKAYIHAHYMQDISLDDVARKVGLSPNYFSQLFSNAEGVNFKEYLTRERVERAGKLLIQGRHSIDDILPMSGFTNIATFYRVFKKYTGYSPRQYSERFRADKPQRG